MDEQPTINNIPKVYIDAIKEVERFVKTKTDEGTILLWIHLTLRSLFANNVELFRFITTRAEKFASHVISGNVTEEDIAASKVMSDIILLAVLSVSAEVGTEANEWDKTTGKLLKEVSGLDLLG